MTDAVHGETSIKDIKHIIKSYKDCIRVNKLAGSKNNFDVDPLVNAVVTADSTRVEVVKEILIVFGFWALKFLKAAAERPRIDLCVLRALLRTNAGDVLDDGCALHYAAMHCESVKVIQMWIAANPAAMGRKNSAGELPLHIAARANKSAEVVRVLCAARPELLRAVDLKNRSPLFVATLSPNSEEIIGEIVRVLLEAYPALAQADRPQHVLVQLYFSDICASLSAHSELADQFNGQSAYSQCCEVL